MINHRNSSSALSILVLERGPHKRLKRHLRLTARMKRFIMNKFLFSLILALVSCACVAQTQVAALDSAAKLPEFKTLYTLSSGFKNNISLTPETDKTARLKIGGERCFLDKTVEVKELSDRFEMVVATMSATNASDVGFCDRQSVVTISKQKNLFGKYQGTWETSGANRPPNFGSFSF